MSRLARAAALLCALLAARASASLHCAMRREISPCTCRREEAGTGSIHVVCQRITAYQDIARALTNKFSPETKIGLDISYSELPDFAEHSFRELGLSIRKLKLNYDNLSELKESVFTKLDLVDFFSLADNSLTEMPKHILRHLPHVKTLDVCRNKITKLSEDDVREEVEHLLAADNQISKIDKHAMPKALKHVHLGLNKLTRLNGALRDLDNLEWVFINANHLKSIEGELPLKAKKLTFIHAASNELQSLPRDLRQMPALKSLYFYDNNIKSLDGAFQKSRKLYLLSLSFNKIVSLAEDDFTETEILQNLDLAYNQLQSLNGSLRNLKSLRYLNLTHNYLTEFSLQEIKGLKRLGVLDLSHNKITQIIGNLENLVNVETKVMELRLDHNKITSLGSALMGLHGLMKLNLSNNLLQQLSPEDLVGLQNLKVLDVSFNQIISLQETSKAFLPILEELYAHHNNLTALDKDFQGLPSLCKADMSFNNIQSISEDLLSKSSCTIDGVRSILNVYLQDNPVLCDAGMSAVSALLLEKWSARVSGAARCAGGSTAAPSLVRALNDGAPALRVLPPPAVGVVVKWPDERRPHPLAHLDHLRQRRPQ